MRIVVLGSGSGGNAVVVESERQRILVDAGFGVKALGARLKAADMQPGSISALILTHEHHDHARGAPAAARRWHWPVYATTGTFLQMGDVRWQRAEPLSSGERPRTRAGRVRRVVDPRVELELDDFAIRFVRAPHDAREHVALVVTERSSGERAGIAYDIGHVTERFARHFTDLDVLLLESNHDDRMLRTGPYPWPVKERVAGPRGHLSNAEAGVFARFCVHRGLRHLMLCHLSETNNQPDLALRSMKRALRGSGFRGSLCAARQDDAVTLNGVVQMELALLGRVGPMRRSRLNRRDCRGPFADSGNTLQAPATVSQPPAHCSCPLPALSS
jgi:phosphoribosyl 1,2-cyclic phosphodiesterase